MLLRGWFGVWCLMVAGGLVAQVMPEHAGYEPAVDKRRAFNMNALSDRGAATIFLRQLDAHHIDLDLMGPYMAKLFSYGLSQEQVLEKAVQRQRYDAWAETKVATVRAHQDDPYVSYLNRLNLDGPHRARLIKVYALCLESYGSQVDQSFRRRVEIGQPMPSYGKAPRSRPTGKERPLRVRDDASKAYAALVQQTRRIVSEHDLGVFEQACLAKCIADEALEYSPAGKHPMRAVGLFLRSKLENAGKNMRHRYGVCTNYATITKGIARDMGFGKQVKVARHGMHFYNQFYLKGQWYHFHPLRKYGKECRFVPYANHGS